MGKTTYIHYGHSFFQPEKMKEKPNLIYTSYKPHGLWASPVDAEWGWKDWCEETECFLETLDESFQFTLKSKANILHIHSWEDAKPFLIKQGTYNYSLKLKTIYKKYDGMELHISENYGELHDSYPFYLWDVDSICIWNPDIIEGRWNYDRISPEMFCESGNGQVRILYPH